MPDFNRFVAWWPWRRQEVPSEELGKDGLLIDFGVIKKKTEDVLDTLDHQFLNELDYFQTINPSSENIARYIFESLSENLKGDHIRLGKVSAWESDTACATYMGPST